jgi:hypothetical protein
VLPLDDFGKHDKVGESRWRARLSSNQERELYILLESPLLIEELGSILPFRGLWGAFHLGVMDMFWSCGAKRFVFPRADFTFLTLQGDYQHIGLIHTTLTSILGHGLAPVCQMSRVE